MKRITIRSIKNLKKSLTGKSISMLTCYDFQSAQALNETDLDLILVGDSLGNVVLGFDETIPVTIEHMKLFSNAVSLGAPNKFIICDVPFGIISSFAESVKSCLELFKSSKAQALKIEGAENIHLDVVKRLTELGVPVMGHIGLLPQSVHGQGGYYTHGKTLDSKNHLIEQAQRLKQAGCFSIVLECVKPEVAKEITNQLEIPTIGIGSGNDTDGQVLVLNDLLGSGKGQPSFANPIDDFFNRKKQAVEKFLNSINRLPQAESMTEPKGNLDVTDRPYS